MFPSQTYFTHEQAVWAIIEALGSRGLDPDLHDIDAIAEGGLRWVPDLGKYSFREPAQFWAVVAAHGKQGPSEEAQGSAFLTWVNEHRDKD